MQTEESAMTFSKQGYFISYFFSNSDILQSARTLKKGPKFNERPVKTKDLFNAKVCVYYSNNNKKEIS